jgi:hypothetical protein
MRMEEAANEELRNLYSSPNIIRQIKSSRVMWAGHVSYFTGNKSIEK